MACQGVLQDAEKVRMGDSRPHPAFFTHPTGSVDADLQSTCELDEGASLCERSRAQMGGGLCLHRRQGGR